MKNRKLAGVPWEPLIAALTLLGLLFTVWDAATAAGLEVGPDEPLQSAIDAAAPGAVLRLDAGVYAGNFVIAKPLTLRGEPGTVLDAQGQGDTVRVTASDVTLSGLTIRRSGHNLTAMNAGVFAEKTAARLTVENSVLELNAFGLWLDGCPDAKILGNRVSGDPTVRSQDRGNGIHLFNVSGAEVADNEVWHTRDGIYIDTSNGNTLRGNTLRDLRYGIHYMYSYDNAVRDNLTRNTRTGYALMQSKRLTVTGNRSQGDQNYGILLNFITQSTLANNIIVDVQRGRSPGMSSAAAGDILGAEGKAIFVYNSQFNTLRDNVFAGAEIGIHLTAGSEDNTLYGNAFIDNQSQVKYVANRPQDWSFEGRGNYWSDYLGWDLDGDGVGDVPYEPNDGVDQLLWRYPSAKLLMSSPAIVTLRWAQRQFPVLKPQGVADSAPLMRPPATIESVL